MEVTELVSTQATLENLAKETAQSIDLKNLRGVETLEGLEGPALLTSLAGLLREQEEVSNG